MDHEEAKSSYAAERYILNELPEDESERFEEHYFNCLECAESVRHLAQISEALRDNPIAPQRQRQLGWKENLKDWWGRPMVGAVAGLALIWFIALSAYQARELRQQFRPQAVTGFLLLPEARGEFRTISREEAGAVLVLETDLPRAVGELKWEVRSEGAGTSVAEGDAQAPKAGSNLKVVLPMSNLSAGQYVMEIRPAAGGQSWLFRFKVV